MIHLSIYFHKPFFKSKEKKMITTYLENRSFLSNRYNKRGHTDKILFKSLFHKYKKFILYIIFRYVTQSHSFFFLSLLLLCLNAYVFLVFFTYKCFYITWKHLLQTLLKWSLEILLLHFWHSHLHLALLFVFYFVAWLTN